MADKQLNTVIVLRNDDKTSWEADDAYVLRDGEVGIGYFTTSNGKKHVIAKVGNGNTPWKALPQLEGVFETDQILTHNFGRHKISNGYVNAGGAGMTTSEWITDALSEILNPTIKYPSISVTSTVYIEGSSTASSTCEIGSQITGIGWNSTFNSGSYKDANNDDTYGTVEDNKSSSTGLSSSNVTWSVKNNLNSTSSATEDGTFILESSEYPQVTSEELTSYGVITVTATLDASNSRTPLNNVGKAYDVGKIKGFDELGTATSTKEAACKVQGYRKPFWGVLSTSIDVTKITSEQVRNLDNSGISTKGFPTTLNVPQGSTQVLFCAKHGEYTTLTAKDTSAMNATVTFTKVESAVNVEGANGYQSIAYDLWYVQWDDPIESAKSLALTWN